MELTDQLNVLELKKAYCEGRIPKHEYFQRMLEKNNVLRQYSELLTETSLSEIRITKDMVVGVGQKFGLKHVMVFEDVSNIPLRTLATGDYEPEEMEFILGLVRPGDTVFDIGGNTGWISMNIARKVPDSKIHVFEPIPHTSAILEKNLEINGFDNISLHKIALSDKEGVNAFYFNTKELGATSMRNIRELNGGATVSVKSERLDDFMRENGIQRLDFIKCDVEGAELLVIRGGLETIKKYRPILFVEMLRKWAAKFDYHPNDIISLLSRNGYSCYAIRHEKLQEMKVMDDSVMCTNFFFVHEDRKAEIARYL
ncbi:MAG: FkbM family methyltransferase [bacterium]